jgi:hypothetical protein
MNTRLRRVLTRPRPRRALLVLEILAAYVPALLRLRRRQLPELVAAARRCRLRVRIHEPTSDTRRTALRLGHAVSRTLAVLPADGRCLVSSLVLSRMLARRGIAASLVVAVRHEPEFGAHAWVEHEGRPLLRPGVVGYKRLVEL